LIQWYIGGQNVTNQATPQPPQQDGDKLIAYSSLVYTGRDVDHNKVILCEAVNIEGKQRVKSAEKSLYIQCKNSLTYRIMCIILHGTVNMRGNKKLNPLINPLLEHMTV
jgi:hypothetical protein